MPAVPPAATPVARSAYLRPTEASAALEAETLARWLARVTGFMPATRLTLLRARWVGGTAKTALPVTTFLAARTMPGGVHLEISSATSLAIVIAVSALICPSRRAARIGSIASASALRTSSLLARESTRLATASPPTLSTCRPSAPPARMAA